MVNPINPTSADTGSAFLKTQDGYVNASFVIKMSDGGAGLTTLLLWEGGTAVVNAPIDDVARACGVVTVMPPPPDPVMQGVNEETLRQIKEAAANMPKPPPVQVSRMVDGKETWGQPD